jgi:hypothetical protein
MAKSGARFAQALHKAIDRIAWLENKKKQVVRDELGYDLGRGGAGPIEYWLYRRQAPSRLKDAERLARLIANRGGWQSGPEMFTMLESAGHPEPSLIIREFFSSFGRADWAGVYQSLTPFVVGSPIYNPRQFFGREFELKRIFHALRASPMQNVFIEGPPRSGKTSLLHYVKNITVMSMALLRPGQFINWLDIPGAYAWVLVDFQDPRTMTQEGFFRLVLEGLDLYEPPLPVHLTEFVDRVARHLQRPAVLLLDGIHTGIMSSALDASFWMALRSLATNLTEGRLAFVVTSPCDAMQLRNNRPDAAAFFDLFSHNLPLGPFFPAEARQLVASAPRAFNTDETDWMLAQSHCWPALLQIFCRARWLANEDGRSDDAWKQEALRSAMPLLKLLS